MENKLLYCGVDVDDKSFNVTVLSRSEGVLNQFKTKPSASALSERLKEHLDKGYEPRICYEAGYLGFSLCRELRRLGLSCEVIAPSLIPELPSEHRKTDRLDSEKLAKFFMNDLLTKVSIPDEVDESVRDLIRSKDFIKTQHNRVRQHILSICRRLGWDYKRTGRRKQTKDHWSLDHMDWLESMIKNCSIEAVKSNLQMLILNMRQFSNQLEFYNDEMIRYADSPRYKPRVDSLLVYRGIDKVYALTLICELGDINRFNHPKAIVSYSGLDIREYSSGGRQKQFGITKMGNPFLRTALVEISQSATKKPRIGRPLERRRKGKKLVFIEIADRCMKRLYSKSTKMIFAGKHINKAKVACARELTGFIWESLRAVQS